MTRLALGTWAFGGNFGFWADQKRKDSLKTIHQAVRSGVLEFDTASAYANGQSEQLLGQQLKRFPLERSSLFISTKTMSLQDVKKALHRLCMTYVDLLYLHWPNSKKDCHPILDGMRKVEGIRNIGICNVNQAYLQTLEDIPLSYIQIPCTLLWTRGLKELKEYCKGKGIKLSGYSPVGMGILSGRHNTPPKDSRSTLYCYKAPKELQALLAYLQELSLTKKCSQSQIAIAWALAQGFDQLVIGARTKEQLLQDLQSDKIILHESELMQLDMLSETLQKTAPSEQDNLFGHRW